MSESERWIVKCEDTKDGSGDVLVELPQDLLSVLELGIGDELTITVINGEIVLKPVRSAAAGRSASARLLQDDAHHATESDYRSPSTFPPTLQARTSTVGSKLDSRRISLRHCSTPVP